MGARAPTDCFQTRSDESTRYRQAPRCIDEGSPRRADWPIGQPTPAASPHREPEPPVEPLSAWDCQSGRGSPKIILKRPSCPPTRAFATPLAPSGDGLVIGGRQR